MTETWNSVLSAEKEKTYYQSMMAKIDRERALGKNVFPQEKDIFTAFDLTAFDKVKVVILGQDPYHGEGQAHGLSFSVLPGIKTPPSLRNIYKELAEDISDFTIPEHGYLESWAKQGVLLLNTVLTVEESKAHSHAKFGWETFTDSIIEQLNLHREGVIFLLWGAHAQKKGGNIDKERHSILKAPHPSPLSAHRGFFGCKHFSKVNELLKSKKLAEINWHSVS
ncbi:uracil-DNA glycosylase [Aliivibrio sp. S4TY2]|uniref:uracil-DNA glycosylase n=1 Tax=unclassified Aliivibrio TaxID=2645654 RepID=UPI002379F92A|nr:MULTISPECIES: uracil-DNA glycosylase [unclassified Aliivibrio]MDD9155051.1 uracil-DNA glycosylase [Aliivibrio sp. S4TY2]MDD9158586.1 uracil-DNA glycosylase [Aliivibrio sp. S4TY1]MDD9163054.1 uracil-DNA glycosylase [Aliivibrio sp. S4MY2]MDD9166585.1 uracil-DNA glycosylase [Aliivibrio sp. S4MY4]MDD9184131.1 uracil-DNA glycosylase [Aliivibrio sp. S4MY3]